MHLFLIGYMGSGKSSVGKRLANRLDMQFIDMDTMIEEYANAEVHEIFEESGEESFRSLETHLLGKVLETESKVIATGGGMPCHSGNIKKMLDSGVVVYLELSPQKILKRVGQGKNKRPLITEQQPEDLMSFITDHLNSRVKYYEQAHLVVDADKINAKALDHIKGEYLDRIK